jgi:hypothetical protein
MHWLLLNKEWLFDGIGVAILTGLVAFLVRRRDSANEHTRPVASATLGDVNAGRDIHINVSMPQKMAVDDKRDSIQEVLLSMTDLVSEMRSCVQNPEHGLLRELFVLPNRRVTLGGSSKPRFIFYEEDLPLMMNQLDILEEHGLVKEVTPPGNNVSIYRMTEKLVAKLRSA